MFRYVLYRVMSREEFEKLEKFGFFSSEFFKKKEKHFTPNEEYAWIIANTNFGNNMFKEKYSVIVRFYLETLKEIPCKVVERRFFDCTIRKDFLNYVVSVKYEVVDKVREPEPLIIFRNKRGDEKKVYRLSELERIIINPSRILFVSEFLLDLCSDLRLSRRYPVCRDLQKIKNEEVKGYFAPPVTGRDDS